MTLTFIVLAAIIGTLSLLLLAIHRFAREPLTPRQDLEQFKTALQYVAHNGFTEEARQNARSMAVKTQSALDRLTEESTP